MYFYQSLYFRLIPSGRSCQLANSEVLHICDCGRVFMIVYFFDAYTLLFCYMLVSLLGSFDHKRSKRNLCKWFSYGCHFCFWRHVWMTQNTLCIFKRFCNLFAVTTRLIIFPNLLERFVRIICWWCCFINYLCLFRWCRRSGCSFWCGLCGLRCSLLLFNFDTWCGS